MRAAAPALLVALGLARTAAAETLTLDEAYQRALTRSETLLIAQVAEHQAALRIKEAWTLLGPTATITGQLVQQRSIILPADPTDPTSTAIPTQLPEIVVATGTLTQPIFRRGFFPSRTAAKQGLVAAAGTTARTREQLRFDVTTVFLQVLRARRLTEVALANQERTNSQLKAASTRYQGGATLRTAVIQAQIDVYRADRQVLEAQEAGNEAAATFERLVGVQPPELVPPGDPLLPGREEALRRAVERSDVRAQRAAAMQSHTLVSVAGAVPWPSFDVQATVTETWPQLPPPYSGNPLGFNWKVLGLFTIPLIQTGDEYVRRALADLDAKSADLHLRLLEKTAREDVGRALALYGARSQELTVAEQQVLQARENYALVQRQFRAGAASSVEVAVAQGALAEAESQQAVARIDRQQAAYQLLFAAGFL